MRLQSFARRKLSVLRTQPLRGLLVLFMAGALLISLEQAWQYGKLTQGFDFLEKWQIGQRIKASNLGVVYSPEYLDLHISSPFLYTLFSIFSSGDYAIDIRVFRLLCLASSMFAVITLSRLLRYPLWAGLAAAALFTCFFQPFFADIRVANVNQIQVGLLALFLLVQSTQSLPGRRFAGGLILGFAIAAKINLAFVALVLLAAWLTSRRLKEAAGFTAGASLSVAIAIIISSASFGSFSIWMDWLRILPQASDYRYDVESGNYALAMLLLAWIGLKASPYLAAGLFGIAIAICLSRSAARKEGVPSRSHERELLADILPAAMGCLIYLLSASLAWIHYYILAIPMILFLLRPKHGWWRRHSLSMIASYGLAAAAAVLVAELPLRMSLGITNPYHGAILINIGTLTLYGLGLRELLIQNNNEALKARPA